MNPKIKIIGAGLTGLLTANILRRHNPEVLERQEDVPHNHHAILRFRSRAVSTATAVPFKRVLVRKGIWTKHDGVKNEATIPMANEYSYRVTGGYSDRSVWNLSPEERWLAPEEFPELLALGVNVTYNSPFSVIDHGSGSPENIAISTLPMPILMKLLGYEHNISFRHQSVMVTSAYLQGENNLQQTIYNGSDSMGWYRASIQGNKVMVESILQEFVTYNPFEDFRFVLENVFNVKGHFSSIQTNVQEYGKISVIPEAERKAFIDWATRKHHIYSVGRFATWRPLLLDDIVNDTNVVDRLISHGSDSYAISLASK